MSEKNFEIDIAGGKGEYLVQKAKNDRSKNFLLLETFPVKILRRPINLNVVRWRLGENSKLPLKENCVDETNINFLFGEIRNKTDDYYPDQEGEYERVIREVLRVLKPHGVLRIVDAQDNTPFIKGILEKVGYNIEQEPAVVNDEQRTEWTKTFFAVHNKLGKTIKESGVIPMEIIATKKTLDNKI